MVDSIVDNKLKKLRPHFVRGSPGAGGLCNIR